MTDPANATLQATAAQNVNRAALSFIGLQLTWPGIGEVTRRRSVRATCAPNLWLASNEEVRSGYAAQAPDPQPRRLCAFGRWRDHGERAANLPPTDAMRARAPARSGASRKRGEPQRLSPRPDLEHYLKRGMCETSSAKSRRHTRGCNRTSSNGWTPAPQQPSDQSVRAITRSEPFLPGGDDERRAAVRRDRAVLNLGR
jgi:hypothetical protein